MNNIITSQVDEFTSTLSPQLVNKTSGAAILVQCPHENITPEIAVIAVSGDDRRPVTYDDAANYSLTRGELMAAAIQNQTNRNYRLESINSMLGLPIENSGPVPMLVLTNQEATFGSSEVLNSIAMQQATDRLGSEQLYVIPSSIHEVILLPHNCGVTPDELDLIIHEVNRNVVQPHDRLAEHSLVYDHRTQALSESHAEQSLPEQATTRQVQHSHDESSANVVSSATPNDHLENYHERRRHT